MKANELRIGNIIADNKGNEETVHKLAHYNEVLHQINDMDEGYYNPIPLTEYWLVRLGFERKPADNSDFYFQFGHIKIFGYDANGYFTNQLVRQIKINHIHQLQNLYFALTGEELVLKG